MARNSRGEEPPTDSLKVATGARKTGENPESDDDATPTSPIELPDSKMEPPTQSFRPKRDAKKKMDQNFISFDSQDVLN